MARTGDPGTWGEAASLAAGRASRPNPSANPVGGRGKKGSRPHVERILAHRAAILRGLLCVVRRGRHPVHRLRRRRSTPSPSNVEAQIDKQWNELEPVIEQYNHVHSQLQKNQAQQKRWRPTSARCSSQVNLAMAQVRGLAVDAYMQGAPNAFDAMLVSGSPTGLTEKLPVLDQLARHQQQQISGVAQLRDKYAADKHELDALTASVAAARRRPREAEEGDPEEDRRAAEAADQGVRRRRPATARCGPAHAR